MSIEAMKQAIEAWDACGRYPDATSDIERLDVAINALRAAIHQAEGQQPATGEPVAWNSIQITSWIGSQLMHEPSMFERAAVCKFVRSLGRHPTLLKHSPKLHPAAPSVPATGEPVAWVVMNGVSKYQVCGARAPADALCSEMQKRHDLSGSLAAFHVLPLYTHPAPSVRDDVVRDAERYRWLRSLEHCNEAWCFIGSGNANSNLDAAIDAAMLARTERQP